MEILYEKDTKDGIILKRKLDLCGQRFGKLVVIERAEDYISPKGKRHTRWKCLCDCGKTTTVLATNLRQGVTTSCGCKVKEIASLLNVSHHESYTRLYDIWHGMKQRCGNPNAHAYDRYGAQGITVCDEWHAYEEFAEWALNNGYEDNLTIDRIDGNKGYEPSNCRWATPKQQARNRKSNRTIPYNGKNITISELCDISGKSRSVVRRMLIQGASPQKIIGGTQE